MNDKDLYSARLIRIAAKLVAIEHTKYKTNEVAQLPSYLFSMYMNICYRLELSHDHMYGTSKSLMEKYSEEKQLREMDFEILELFLKTFEEINTHYN